LREQPAPSEIPPILPEEQPKTPEKPLSAPADQQELSVGQHDQKNQSQNIAFTSVTVDVANDEQKLRADVEADRLALPTTAVDGDSATSDAEHDIVLHMSTSSEEQSDNHLSDGKSPNLSLSSDKPEESSASFVDASSAEPFSQASSSARAVDNNLPEQNRFASSTEADVTKDLMLSQTLEKDSEFALATHEVDAAALEEDMELKFDAGDENEIFPTSITNTSPYVDARAEEPTVGGDHVDTAQIVPQGQEIEPVVNIGVLPAKDLALGQVPASGVVSDEVDADLIPQVEQGNVECVWYTWV